MWTRKIGEQEFEVTPHLRYKADVGAENQSLEQLLIPVDRFGNRQSGEWHPIQIFPIKEENHD